VDAGARVEQLWQVAARAGLSRNALALMQEIEGAAQPGTGPTSMCPRAVPNPTSSNTGTGREEPFTRRGPSARRVRKPWANRAACPVKYTFPGSARACIRCAKPTVCPMAV
jgi:hypothetical protein